MFGLGWMEISLLVVVLVLVFGPGKAGNLLGKAFGTLRKVDRVKQEVRAAVDPLNYIKPSQEKNSEPAEGKSGNGTES